MVEKQENADDPIDELCKIKKNYVDKTWTWYCDHSTWPRVVFRLTGVTVIVLSLSIPFLAAAGGKLLTVGVSVAALSIAILSALNAFFAWQKTWEKRITTQLTLEGLIAVWETKIAEARRATDEKDGYQFALKATQELIDNTRSLTVTETGTFFASIKFPDVGPAGGNKQDTH